MEKINLDEQGANASAKLNIFFIFPFLPWSEPTFEAPFCNPFFIFEIFRPLFLVNFQRLHPSLNKGGCPLFLDDLFWVFHNYISESYKTLLCVNTFYLQIWQQPFIWSSFAHLSNFEEIFMFNKIFCCFI